MSSSPKYSRPKRPRLILTLRTFNLSEKSRYGLSPRRHAGYKETADRSPRELFNSVRGLAWAIRLAYHHGNEEDLKCALVQVQEVAAEFVRRLASEERVEVNRQGGDIADMLSEAGPVDEPEL